MIPVFLDTVGLLALWDADDQWHDQADAAFSDLLSQKSTFITTTFVLLECGNAAARRPFRKDVVDLWRLFLNVSCMTHSLQLTILFRAVGRCARPQLTIGQVAFF